MNNVLELNGGIVLTLSDDVMNKLFGELLVSQVNNLQRQVDALTMTVAKLQIDNEETDNSIVCLENSIEEFSAKFDDMPDLDEMAGQIEGLEEIISPDSVAEMQSSIEKFDSEMDAVNKIFRAIAEAVYSQSKVHI